MQNDRAPNLVVWRVIFQNEEFPTEYAFYSMQDAIDSLSLSYKGQPITIDTVAANDGKNITLIVKAGELHPQHVKGSEINRIDLAPLTVWNEIIPL